MGKGNNSVTEIKPEVMIIISNQLIGCVIQWVTVTESDLTVGH